MRLKDKKHTKSNDASKKQEKLNKDEQAFRAKVNKTREEWIITINILDLILQNTLKEITYIKEGKLTKSISDVDKHARAVLEKLFDSKEVKAMYQDKDRKLEMKPLFDELRKVRPSKWNKEAYYSLSVIKAKVDAIRTNPENLELIKKVESIFVWE